MSNFKPLKQVWIGFCKNTTLPTFLNAFLDTSISLIINHTVQSYKKQIKNHKKEQFKLKMLNVCSKKLHTNNTTFQNTVLKSRNVHFRILNPAESVPFLEFGLIGKKIARDKPFQTLRINPSARPASCARVETKT